MQRRIWAGNHINLGDLKDLQHIDYHLQMKILSLKIRQGGGTRAKCILREIEQVADCDMIVLTEIRNDLNLPYFKSVLDYLGNDH
mgnify:CR=1 FL=1